MKHGPCKLSISEQIEDIRGEEPDPDEPKKTERDLEIAERIFSKIVDSGIETPYLYWSMYGGVLGEWDSKILSLHINSKNEMKIHFFVGRDPATGTLRSKTLPYSLNDESVNLAIAKLQYLLRTLNE